MSCVLSLNGGYTLSYYKCLCLGTVGSALDSVAELAIDFFFFFLPCSSQQLMTVRTITGNIYYARSGTKVVGKVHEKFTLIDGIRVATGSYRYVQKRGLSS